MKFRDYLSLLSDPSGFFPTPLLQLALHTNPRTTAREEAIAASILEQANPRQNISSHFPWGPEQSLVLQQLWFNPSSSPPSSQWRDIPFPQSSSLFSSVHTDSGESLPVPNAILHPSSIQADFNQRLNQILG